MPRWPAAGAGHLVRVVMLAYKSIDEPLPACKARPVHLRLCTAQKRLSEHLCPQAAVLRVVPT